MHAADGRDAFDSRDGSDNRTLPRALTAPIDAVKAKLADPKFSEFLSKFVPLAIMFFCTSFNYSILRDTKVRGVRVV